MSEPKCTTAEVKQDKHIMIDDAICNMDSVISHANDLLNKIRGAADEDTPKNEPERPSLSTILNGAADEIKEKTSNLHDILNRVDEELF